MPATSEIESALGQALLGFAAEYLGQSPSAIHVYTRPGLILIRFQGVLGVTERQLLHTSDSVRGRDLLKKMRTELIESARPLLVSLVTRISGIQVISMHHDLSTVTGEEMLIFTVVESSPLSKRN